MLRKLLSIMDNISHILHDLLMKQQSGLGLGQSETSATPLLCDEVSLPGGRPKDTLLCQIKDFL